MIVTVLVWLRLVRVRWLLSVHHIAISANIGTRVRNFPCRSSRVTKGRRGVSHGILLIGDVNLLLLLLFWLLLLQLLLLLLRGLTLLVRRRLLALPSRWTLLFVRLHLHLLTLLLLRLLLLLLSTRRSFMALLRPSRRWHLLTRHLLALSALHRGLTELLLRHSLVRFLFSVLGLFFLLTTLLLLRHLTALLLLLCTLQMSLGLLTIVIPLIICDG
mmetsp:Transcript_31656/g.61985  ORF Transcript_31656/g.61985 Transcript_31656/m.61985 type:complete len:216 (+) Transcript_31656:270-917(+)